MDKQASYNVHGDYGNPTGTGVATITATFSDDDPTTAATEIQTFHAALLTAQLTTCTLGDITLSYTTPGYNDKPATTPPTNVDRVLLATWRLKSDRKIHRLTIPGIPASSTAIDKIDSGDRLNSVGKAALATAIEVCGGYDEDDVVVLQGKVFQKK